MISEVHPKMIKIVAFIKKNPACCGLEAARAIRSTSAYTYKLINDLTDEGLLDRSFTGKSLKLSIAKTNRAKKLANACKNIMEVLNNGNQR